jgi:hypothetical protein
MKNDGMIDRDGFKIALKSRANGLRTSLIIKAASGDTGTDLVSMAARGQA